MANELVEIEFNDLYSQTVLADGAVSYWRLGETVGNTTAYDSIGASHCSITNISNFGQDGAINAQNSSFNFVQGTSGQLLSTVIPSTKTTAWSLECWASVNYISTSQVIVKNGDNTSGWGIAVGGTTEANRTFYIIANNSTANSGLQFDTVGTWNHLVLTHDGSNMTLWMNGNKGTPTGITPSTPSNVFTIGHTTNSTHTTPTNFFSGGVDEVAIYNTAIDEATIRNHYKIGTDYPRYKPWIRSVSAKTGKKRNAQMFKVNRLLDHLALSEDHDNNDVPKVSERSNGVLNGTYRYKVTFCIYDESTKEVVAETSASSTNTDFGATVPISVFNKQIMLESIPTSEVPSINARRIYRSNNKGDYHLLITIKDNVTVSYIDNIADYDIDLSNSLIAFQTRYLGTGVTKQISWGNKLQGNKAKVILFKNYSGGTSEGSTLVTDTMAIGYAKVLSATGNFTTGHVLSINKSSVTISSGTHINTNSALYYMQVISGNDIETGTYIGDGTTTRIVPVSINFPKLIWVIPDGTTEANRWYTSDLGSGSASLGGAGILDSKIASISETNFSVNTALNNSGIKYHWVAFRGNGVNTGAYAGNSSAQTVSFPGPKLQDSLTNTYDSIWLQLGTQSGATPMRVSLFTGANSIDINTNTIRTTSIIALDKTGFSLGSFVQANGTGKTFYWFSLGNFSQGQKFPTKPNSLGLPLIAGGGTSLDRPALEFNKAASFIAKWNKVFSSTTAYTPRSGELWAIDNIIAANFTTDISATVNGLPIWSSSTTGGTGVADWQSTLPIIINSTMTLSTTGNFNPTGELNFFYRKLAETDNVTPVCQSVDSGATKYTVPANSNFILYGVKCTDYTASTHRAIVVSGTEITNISPSINHDFNPGLTMPLVIGTGKTVQISSGTATIWGLTILNTL